MPVMIRFGSASTRKDYLATLRKRLYDAGFDPPTATDWIRIWFPSGLGPFYLTARDDAERACDVANEVRGAYCKLLPEDLGAGEEFSGFDLFPDVGDNSPSSRDQCLKAVDLPQGAVFRVGNTTWEVWRSHGVTKYLTRSGTKGKKLYQLVVVGFEPCCVEVWEINPGSGVIKDPKGPPAARGCLVQEHEFSAGEAPTEGSSRANETISHEARRTIYFFRKYDQAGPFLTQEEAEEAKFDIIEERFGVESFDELDEFDREMVEEALEIVPAEVEVWITSAPEGYDGFGTVTLEVLPRTRKGEPLRVVGIFPQHVKWQTMRYSSAVSLNVPISELESIEAFLDQ